MTEKGLILVDEGEVGCVGRQQPFFNGTRNVIATTPDALPPPPLQTTIHTTHQTRSESAALLATNLLPAVHCLLQVVVCRSRSRHLLRVQRTHLVNEEGPIFSNERVTRDETALHLALQTVAERAQRRGGGGSRTQQLLREHTTFACDSREVHKWRSHCRNRLLLWLRRFRFAFLSPGSRLRRVRWVGKR